MEIEIERELMEASSPTPPDLGESQFEKMLGEAMTSIDGLMLVTVTDSDRVPVIREALAVFHEPRFEEALIDKCYDAFDDIRKLHVGSSDIMTLFYDAMQVVQFRVGPYYGTIVCDYITNMGMVHNLVDRVRDYLNILSRVSKEGERSRNEDTE
ncbi:hypothetical protein LPJ81_002417 [Coemansia sp. IMI 209127]|nr:hypothetical protein LPJ81_002417 [Coemansia sp. IMI 209127]